MKTIAHRAGAGLAHENSAAAIRAALAIKVARLEIDVRLTADRKLVVCHDATLKRVANDPRRISQFAWAELLSVRLKDGSRLLNLPTALELIGSTPVIIELKDLGGQDELLQVLASFPNAKVTVASFNRKPLLKLKAMRPDLPLYKLSLLFPCRALLLAHRQAMAGIGIHFLTLNPLVYWLSGRWGLELYVYTVDNRFWANFINKLYPRVVICTNHPERFSS